MRDFLDKFDGVQRRNIFVLWTGPETMSTNRIQALWSIFNNSCCSITYINMQNIKNWIKPDYPLHPAFLYLSSTHKSDYLRCYLMHHYGGGYTDIKQTNKNWHSFFQNLEKSNCYALGYRELSHGIPHLTGILGDEIRRAHNDLIGLCAFIFKKNSPLTQVWLDQTHFFLDKKLPMLMENPAQHPLDQINVILPHGEISKYPLRWAEMLGEIFHPLIFSYKDMLNHDEIQPIFSGYR
jgi:hypothetical protein